MIQKTFRSFPNQSTAKGRADTVDFTVGLWHIILLFIVNMLMLNAQNFYHYALVVVVKMLENSIDTYTMDAEIFLWLDFQCKPENYICNKHNTKHVVTLIQSVQAFCLKQSSSQNLSLIFWICLQCLACDRQSVLKQWDTNSSFILQYNGSLNVVFNSPFLPTSKRILNHGEDSVWCRRGRPAEGECSYIL